MKLNKLTKFTLVWLLMSLFFTGCGQEQATVRNQNSTKSVNDILNEETKEINTTLETLGTSNSESKEFSVSENSGISQKVYDVIDIDLTDMSSTMVYSEVLNITQNPQAYIGKVIKMQGSADVFTDPNTDITYQTCVIADAAACCAQGIEFELTDGKDQVKSGDQVTVVGVFDVYAEGNYFYCTLRNAIKL